VKDYGAQGVAIVWLLMNFDEMFSLAYAAQFGAAFRRKIYVAMCLKANKTGLYPLAN